jgi:putative glutathione S-transferase
VVAPSRLKLPGVAETVNMDYIREHNYRTHPDVNPKRIVAIGPNHDFLEPHGCDWLAGGPPEELITKAATGD